MGRNEGAMNAPTSAPSSQQPLLRLAAGGTIVGMPAVVPLPEPQRNTLPSVYDSAREAGPLSDPFHPERWSEPPPSGALPIIPCDEPEDEDVARIIPVLSPATAAPTPAIAERWVFPAAEPVVLPMDRTGTRLAAALVLALGGVLALTTALALGWL